MLNRRTYNVFISTLKFIWSPIGATWIACAILLSACGSASIKHGTHDSTQSSQSSPERETSRISKVQRGLASWYGKRFRGRRTASGERFNPKELTAAHRTLPLGSHAKVTCLKTGKSIIVTINDRGPFSSHRVIDLSREAAKKLGMISMGVAQVEVEPVSP